MASTIKVDKLDPQSGTDLEIGSSGDTATIPSGATLTIASGATLTNSGTATGFPEYDDNVVQSNIAMLGFKVAVNGSLVRYNLVDQSIDEFYDTSGVDASASTNAVRIPSGSNFYYEGGTPPTITQDADATGVDGLYTWYKWTDTGATGSYSTNTTTNHDYLVIAGGGGGGNSRGGGGGAGGYLTATGLSLVGSTTYTVTIGTGGAGGDGSPTRGANGVASSIVGSDITDVITVGGGSGGSDDETGAVGGSGGAGGGGGAFAGGAGTAGQGYAGGSAVAAGGYDGAGGGGAGGAGTPGNPIAGVGGAGLSNSYDGSATVRASGGGGGNGSGTNTSAATPGGGGRGGWNSSGDISNATANTGGGGGGAGDGNGGDGGSGIIIIRRLTTGGSVAGANLTLQSTDVTAEATPTYGEFVTLIENAYGTATLNTDIKGYVSRDSGANFTQGTLVDEGSWGTNKQILGFHDLDISSQPSGTSMCYKIETLNQSASSKETRIYATSIGWR